MKLRNECDICATEYLAPLDIEWEYELSDFVTALSKSTMAFRYFGRGVLQDRMFRGAFWYLPEVDLYESDDDPDRKNEIDALCMLVDCNN